MYQNKFTGVQFFKPYTMPDTLVLFNFDYLDISDLDIDNNSGVQLGKLVASV